VAPRRRAPADTQPQPAKMAPDDATKNPLVLGLDWVAQSQWGLG